MIPTALVTLFLIPVVLVALVVVAAIAGGSAEDGPDGDQVAGQEPEEVEDAPEPDGAPEEAPGLEADVVPALVGLALPEARVMAVAAGYSLDEVDASGRGRVVWNPDNWVVESQQPDAGTENGDTITVEVSNVMDLDEGPSVQDAATIAGAFGIIFGDRFTDYFVDGDVGFLYFEASDNLTRGMIRRGIESDIAQAIRAAFHEPGSDLDLLHVTASFPLIDQFGNESQGDVYAVTIDRATAGQVNWDNPHAIDWPNVWETRFTHPDFR
ncbi:MAG: PASTA domain-containing protein [Dehalococcoidia bacterium]